MKKFLLVLFLLPTLAWGDRTWTVTPGAPDCVDNDTGECALPVARNSGDPEFVAANIRSGTNILNVTGSLTAAYATCTNDGAIQCSLSATRSSDDAQFIAANIKSGVNILNVTGTLVEASAACSNDVATQCDLQATRSTGDADFVAANIFSGTNILGVTGTGVASGDTTTGLTHHWKFDDTSGTNATDSSGNSHTGVLTNGPVWSPNEGINGGALFFDGTNDYVDVATPALPTGDFTYSVWVNGTGDEVTTTFFTARNGSADEILLNTTGGNLGIGLNIQDGLSTIVGSTNNATLFFPTGWHLLTLTRTGNLLVFYMDAAPRMRAYTEGALNFSTCQLLIGVNSNATCNTSLADHFIGLMDDFRIYSRGLTAQDVTKLYRDFRAAPTDHSGANDLTTGLLIHLPMDEGTGTTAEDATVNNKDGTLVNGPTWGAGHIGAGAVVLDGTNDFVEIASPALPTGDFTYSLWVKRANTTSAAATFLASQTGSGASTTVLQFFRNNNTQAGIILNSTSVLAGKDFNSATTDWMHLAWTRRGGWLQMFQNGEAVLADSYSTALGFTDCSLLLGMDADGTACTGTPTELFPGSLDDLRIYNRALRQAEVVALAAM